MFTPFANCLQGRRPGSSRKQNIEPQLRYYSQFFEAVHAAHIYSLEENDVINKTLSTLQS